MHVVIDHAGNRALFADWRTAARASRSRTLRWLRAWIARTSRMASGYQSFGCTAPRVILQIFNTSPGRGTVCPFTMRLIETRFRHRRSARSWIVQPCLCTSGKLNHSRSVIMHNVLYCATACKVHGKDAGATAYLSERGAAVLYAGMATPNDDPATDAEKLAFKKAMGRRLFMSRMLINENRTWLADSMGVLHTRWRMWEEGVHDMDLRVMKRFCEKWGFTADWFVLGRYETLPSNIRSLLHARFPEDIQPYIEAMTRLPSKNEAPNTAVLPLPTSLAPLDGSQSDAPPRKKRPKNFRKAPASI